MDEKTQIDFDQAVKMIKLFDTTIINKVDMKNTLKNWLKANYITDSEHHLKKIIELEETDKLKAALNE